jgi:hypothetical protein
MAHDEDDHLGRKLKKGSDHREGDVAKRKGAGACRGTYVVLWI